jgi:hypothetical protein
MDNESRFVYIRVLESSANTPACEFDVFVVVLGKDAIEDA